MGALAHAFSLARRRPLWNRLAAARSGQRRGARRRALRCCAASTRPECGARGHRRQSVPLSARRRTASYCGHPEVPPASPAPTSDPTPDPQGKSAYGVRGVSGEQVQGVGGHVRGVSGHNAGCEGAYTGCKRTCTGCEWTCTGRVDAHLVFKSKNRHASLVQ